MSNNRREKRLLEKYKDSGSLKAERDYLIQKIAHENTQPKNRTFFAWLRFKLSGDPLSQSEKMLIVLDTKINYYKLKDKQNEKIHHPFTQNKTWQGYFRSCIAKLSGLFS